MARNLNDQPIIPAEIPTHFEDGTPVPAQPADREDSVPSSKYVASAFSYDRD